MTPTAWSAAGLVIAAFALLGLFALAPAARAEDG